MTDPAYRWLALAACVGTDSETFFPSEARRNAYDKARAICADCPVSAQCLATAMAEEEEAAGIRYGMRGGLSPSERDARYAAARR